MNEEIIKNSETITEAIMSIYGYDNGKSRKKFKTLIDNNKIDISHLTKRKFIYERINKKCPICGVEFETMKNHKREKMTCSHSCSNSFFRSGNNNPNWKGEERSEYEKEYRRICFEYHKKECIVCGENKIVAVHHYDENHNNNSIDNLIPLCPTHHQYIHSRYKNEILSIVDEYKKNFVVIPTKY
jgi:predicted restriction endonuclease